MANKHSIFSSDSKISYNAFLDYLKNINSTIESADASRSVRVEGRSRKNDFSEALSFEVQDPLWMLTRQWQFGRFQGNDCGSAVTVKIKTTKQNFSSIHFNSGKQAFSNNTPLEYEVEKQNKQITPFIRIQSALHFKKMMEIEFATSNSGFIQNVIERMRNNYPLVYDDNADGNDIEYLKEQQNVQLKRYYASYKGRIFDGYKLFLDVTSGYNNIERLFRNSNDANPTILTLFVNITERYVTWFKRKYQPLPNESANCWNEEKMGYDIKISEKLDVLSAEDYHTGKLSWYSFDSENINKGGRKLPGMNNYSEVKFLSYLPTPAHFPGAPNRRLWQFEDAKTQFGHHTNNDFSLMSNAIVMQYATMYGNDWMITPLESETGTWLDVEGIIVTDTFGERIYIDTPASKSKNNGSALTARWDLFGTLAADAYATKNFSSERGLFFPPTIPRYEESKPIEEIQFLRDEMANMLWAVETIINNRCDGTLIGKDLSDAVLAEIDSTKYTYHPDKSLAADYSYVLQSRVAVNWIPFVPQKIVGEAREIRFRRARMPLFYNNTYQSVRPSTELLKINKTGDKVKARFLNEEEIIGYGVKLILTAQRTRWFLGKSFTWIGAKKVINQYQANSGLMFDELHEVNNAADNH